MRAFNCATGELEDLPDPPLDLETARASQWEAVKSLRDVRENGHAPTPFGPVQSDDRSKLKISGLVQMALIAKSAGQPFSEDFTLADNSVVTLSADQTIGLGVAVGRYVSDLHARARALREEIQASSTQEDLDAVDINSGWP